MLFIRLLWGGVWSPLSVAISCISLVEITLITDSRSESLSSALLSAYPFSLLHVTHASSSCTPHVCCSFESCICENVCSFSWDDGMTSSFWEDGTNWVGLWTDIALLILDE